MPARANNPSLLSLVAALAGAIATRGPVWAQSFSFTDGCEGNLSSADEALVEEAYLVAYRYQDRVWDEIDVDDVRAANPNPCGRGDGDDAVCASFQQQKCYYSEVPDKHREKWEEAIEHVKVNCDSNKCSRNSSQYGFCGLAAWDIYPSDKILLCVDNIRSAASYVNRNNSADAQAADTFAWLAGTIAHEIMHQADGFEGHPTGFTEARSPNTSAESVGTAMEHILLSPDLSTSIRSIDVAWNGSVYEVNVESTVSNLNEYSGPVGTAPRSLRVRNNTDARLEILVDGTHLDYHYVAPIAGGDSIEFDFSFEMDTAAGNGLHQLTIVTDDLDNIWELDEENNETTKTFSLATDLAVEVEIAGPYTTTSKTTASGGVIRVTTYRRLTYDVTVTNRDDALTSPPSELLIQYDNMWSGGSLASTTESVPELWPGDTAAFSFSVDVPVSIVGVISTTDVYVTADPDELVADSDRDNNSVHIAIDNAYFKPDYRITLNSLTIDGNDVVADYTVKNIGPEPATAYSWVGFYINGSLSSSGLTGKLAAAASASGSLSSSFVGLENLDSEDITFVFLVKADRGSAITEYDENNNTESVTITVPGVTLLSELERDDDWASSAILRDGYLRYLPETSVAIFGEVFGGAAPATWYFENAGNGPFLPDVTYDEINAVVVMRNAYSTVPPAVFIYGR